MENEKLIGIILPEWLLQGPTETKIDKINNLNSLKQITRDNFNLDDKQFKKELADRWLILIISLIEIWKWDSKIT